MGNQDSRSDGFEAVLPKIGVNYVVSKVVTIPNGAYYPHRVDRACILMPLSVATVGTVLIYAGGMPPNTESTIPIPAGNTITLDGRGLWYIKTGSSQSEKFLEVDAGQAGNMQAIASALGLTSTIGNIAQIGGATQTAVDVAGKFQKRTQVAPPSAFGLTNASQLALAARAGRRSLYAIVMNMASGCTKVTLSFTTPVVSLKGYQFNGNDSWKQWDALSGICEDAVYGICDAGTADVYFVECT
jgi:hypothetical protein